MKAKACVFVMAILVVWGLSVSSNHAKKVFDLKADAVAVWSFDEGSGNKVKDGSGNGNDGELQGGPKWIKGKYGQALDFNGVGAYVNIKSNPRFVPKSNQVTAVAWVFMKGGGKVSIVENNADNWGLRFASIPNLDAYVTISVAENWKHVQVDAVPQKEWVHVAFVWDGKIGKLYVNGKEKANAPMAGDLRQPIGQGYAIARRGADTASQYFPGYLDEIAILDVAATEADIGILMKTGLDELLAVSPRGKVTTTWAQMKAQD